MVIHADKLRWLLWLRWKMLLRSFMSSGGKTNWGRIIGLIFLALFGLPFIGSIAVGTYFAYHYLPAPINSEILFLVLTGIYLLWIVLPLLEFTVNEGLDLSKLTLFPLTRAELMSSLVLSSLLDVPTLGLLLVFAAVVAGWSFSLPLTLMALLCMLIFYVQIISASQLVLALLMRTLQSRRFRDLSIIIIALFSSSCYLIQQFVFHALGVANGGFMHGLRTLNVSPYLQWLPPGMAARAIQQASIGNWGLSFVWLGALLVISVILLYLWQLVVERALTSDLSGGTVRAAKRRTRGATSSASNAPVSTVTAAGWSLLPPQVTAIALKDLRYFRRDPQLQALFFQSLISIIVLIFITVVNFNRTESIGGWVVLVAPVYALLSLYSLSSNMFGMERQSLTTLFLFPVEPRYILWGKNLVIFVAGIVEDVLLIILAAVVSHGWNFVLPALAAGIAGICIIMGCGNFTSVYFPMRVRQARRGFQTGSNLSFEAGCLRGIMSLVALLVTGIVLLPVALALALPIYFNLLWLWTLSIPLSIIYGAAFYYVVTLLVAPRLAQRVPEILNVVARE
jgi:ABC-2 type transport system permease protein